MIGHISLKSFRAFRAQSFNFSKLNIFVGPNNSGKSSALSALNVLAQTMNSPSFDSGPIVLNGQFDQLGTFKDVVHGGWSSTPIGIEFSFDEYVVNFELKHRQQRRETELSSFKLSHKGRSVFEYSTTRDRFDLLLFGSRFEDIHPNTKKERPYFSGFWPILPSAYRYESGGRQRRRGPDEHSELIDKVEHTLRRARMHADGIFRSYDSLSPFRDQPLRTYLYSGETSRYIGRTGENTVLLLANDSSKRGSERKGFVEDISRWMVATDIAKGIKIKTLTPRHFELCVIGKDGTEHNICDVGFGCSQVLPVLISGLKHLFATEHGGGSFFGPPILVIQEPEIHLHPNAQASLGSFFASLVRERGQIFIETHSDILVLRIARHVALGDLSARDVKVFYVDDVAGEKTVEEMEIQSNGTFIPDWPGGFFPQRQSESFALARAAVSARSSSLPKQLDFFYPEEKN